MTQKTLTAFWLSLLGGLWMLLSGRFMYGSFTRMPGRSPGGWGHHHMLWGRGILGHFGLGWPWLGLIAGAIVIVSAAILYAYPRHRQSMGITILLVSLLNLVFGMGGMMASALGIVGGVVALLPKEVSREEESSRE
ncbi:hypothetical protein S7335_457 [Synechococcus sp. PCC 7335]|uniref:hypothetical protein n=1 Tax=Synechococcus sp. (strain ATCC 29403 / PCC 7335) TaxID=91464 RepID=UPI00017ECEFC|nr:hypothetical protein [Synechococcus sp. PCC 7335]EDX83277.1 hypothetical protein S7335_457 [Synechococcus sp. PCC 7335]